MHSIGDVLGDEGRKALDACVKVKIYGRPQNIAKYRWCSAKKKLKECYAGGFPDMKLGFQGQDEHLWNRVLPAKNTDCDIIKIHEALEGLDKMLFVEKYPKKGPRSDKLKKLIDERRADIERECKEATADPDTSNIYSWLVAQRRVRDCYAGSFAGDRAFLKYREPLLNCEDGRVVPIKMDESGTTQTYSIFDIHEAVEQFDEQKLIQKYPEDEGPGSHELKKSIEENNYKVKKEYEKTNRMLRIYSRSDAEKRVRGCFLDNLSEIEELFPVKEDESREPNIDQTYDIFDIHKVIFYHDTNIKKNDKQEGLTKYEEQEKVKNRDAISQDLQEARKKISKYSRSEAERRARDCFAGTFKEDTDIFYNKEEQKCGIQKIHQTYTIFDIKNAIDHFDTKKLCDKYLDEEHPDSKRENQRADDQRKKIEEEYAEATLKVEIEHGSGFIVHDHFIVTNKHVIADAENDKTKEICVSNAAIGEHELLCKVACTDAVKDLALLYCQELNIEQNGITPLHLSNQSLLPGMQIFSFGYPMSHRGEKAIFVNGYVSGSKETNNQLCLLNHMMVVLNCSLNSGSSGGPILCWENGDLKVSGVATQKHFKEILTLKEIEKVEKIRESLQTCTIADDSDIFRNHQVSMNLLTLKLYDALETHSQFNLSNALPGHCVIEFIQETISKYKGEGKEELLEILKWSRVA